MHMLVILAAQEGSDVSPLSSLWLRHFSPRVLTFRSSLIFKICQPYQEFCTAAVIVILTQEKAFHRKCVIFIRSRLHIGIYATDHYFQSFIAIRRNVNTNFVQPHRCFTFHKSRNLNLFTLCLTTLSVALNHRITDFHLMQKEVVFT